MTTLEVRQIESDLPSFVDGLLSVFDESSCKVKSCVAVALDAYAQKCVNNEPEKPEDWRRPGEVAQCRSYGECEVCSEINKFLQEDVKVCTVHMPRHRWESERTFRYMEIENTAPGDEIFTATTTLKKWEADHKQWKARLATATEKIGKMPEGPLRQCLGDRYDEYLQLEMLKKVEDGATGAESVAPRVLRQRKSVVPQKRMRSAS